MTVRRIIAIVAQAIIFGLILALLFGGGEQVSTAAWFAALAVWLVGTVALHLISVAAVERARLVVAWRWRPRGSGRDFDPRPWGLRTMEGLLGSACHNPRAHAFRLRPHLSALADHYLRDRRGIDPAGVAEVLGDVAFLIDPTVADRIPTMAEIETFLDIVLADAPGAPA